MPPKPIVKKIFIPDAQFLETHPEMKRSSSSMAMETLVDEQKAIVANAGPNIQKLLSAIKDSDRYEALTDPSGYIASMETEVGSLCNKAIVAETQLQSLVDCLEIPKLPEHPSGTSKCPAGEPDITAMKEFWAKKEEFWSQHNSENVVKIATKFRLEAMRSSRIALDLAKAVSKLNELKKEADELEAKIVDDSNLPDFESMNDEEKKKKVDRMAVIGRSIALEAGVVNEDARIDDGSQPGYVDISSHPSDDNPEDKPIKWSYWYETGGDVISPSKEGAMAMAALRIKRTVVAEHINAWQEK